MSHISKIELEVKDLKTLAKACTRLGLKLVKGQKLQMVRHRRREVRPRHQGPGATYEIGVIKRGFP